MNAAVNAFFLIFKLLSLYFFGCFALLPVQAKKAGSFRRTAAVRHIDRGQK